jgi:hypothetical protein
MRWPSGFPLFNKPLSTRLIVEPGLLFRASVTAAGTSRQIHVALSHPGEKNTFFGKKGMRMRLVGTIHAVRKLLAVPTRTEPARTEPTDNLQPQRGVTEKKIEKSIDMSEHLSSKSIIISFYRDVICWFPIRVPSGRCQSCHPIRNRLLQEFTDWESSAQATIPSLERDAGQGQGRTEAASKGAPTARHSCL